MKTLRVFFAVLVASALCAAGVRQAFAGEEGYDRLAKELSGAAAKMTQPKVAIIPFTYIDKRKSDAGVIISERLTTRLVKLGKCTVIERQLLENVLKELHLESSGVVDVETTKQLGKVLGVEAIINGTLMDVEDEMVEINARVIRTETAEVITTASAEIKKTWADVGEQYPAVTASAPTGPAVLQTAYQAPVQEQAVVPAASQGAPKIVAARRKLTSYIDIFFAPSGSSKMDLTFSNDSSLIREPALRLDLNGSGTLDSGVGYNKVSFKNANAAAVTPPIGFRIVGFDKHWGGDFEISYQSWRLEKGKTTVSYDGGAGRPFAFFVDDYLTVNIFTLGSGDLLYRFSDKIIQPYVGVGMGLSLNTVQSPYIANFGEGHIFRPPLNEVALGFQFRVPIGVRVELDKNIHAFVEYRPMYNTIWFSRTIEDESDTVVLSQDIFMFGLGFKM